MKYPRAILVPLDLSSFSCTALVYAEEIAALFPHAAIHVVHVPETAEGGPEKEIDASLTAKAHAELTRLLLEKQISHTNVTILIRHGKPASTIVRTAKDIGADLIVMCTHGRTGLGHMLMGSVAEKVVRQAPCPVLTIKPEAFREIVSLSEEDVAGSLHLQMES